jgi:GNAT superfamily N-acetyltransferase
VSENVDRPDVDLLRHAVWHGLQGAHASLGMANAGAANYALDVSVFAALAPGADDLTSMAELVGAEEVFGLLVDAQETPSHPGFEILTRVPCHQMICTAPVLIEDDECIALGANHIAQMLALVKLTDPGPFAARTIEMGSYFGIFDGESLLAMAGERMRPRGWIEVSAVCTHPDAQGRGYAARLVSRVLRGIDAAGCGAFLHVVKSGPSEKTAVGVYERLGFRHHRGVVVQIMRRRQPA